MPWSQKLCGGSTFPSLCEKEKSVWILNLKPFWFILWGPQWGWEWHSRRRRWRIIERWKDEHNTVSHGTFVTSAFRLTHRFYSYFNQTRICFSHKNVFQNIAIAFFRVAEESAILNWSDMCSLHNMSYISPRPFFYATKLCYTVLYKDKIEEKKGVLKSDVFDFTGQKSWCIQFCPK